MALIDKLTAVADAIREKTGGTEEMTLDAMAKAIAGIEAGGSSSGDASGIYMAEITPASDLDFLQINHNLGTTDILLAAAWAETLGDIVPDVMVTLAKVWMKTDIKTQRDGDGFSPGYSWNTTNNYASVQAPNTSLYEQLTITDADNIKLPKSASSTNNKYIAGVTYTVIIIAASAGSVTEV